MLTKDFTSKIEPPLEHEISLLEVRETPSLSDRNAKR